MIEILHKNFDTFPNAEMKKRNATAIGEEKLWKERKIIQNQDIWDWLSGQKGVWDRLKTIDVQVLIW